MKRLMVNVSERELNGQTTRLRKKLIKKEGYVNFRCEVGKGTPAKGAIYAAKYQTICLSYMKWIGEKHLFMSVLYMST